MTAKQQPGVYAPDGSLYITLTDGVGTLVNTAASALTVGTSAVGGGTTTRVLYDNAGVLGEYVISGSGNVAMTTSPSFTTPILGTPTSGVATNLTGTAAGLTAGTVTTNANLTGPITSAGNATAVAAQTGTGTTFAMSASPTFTGTVTYPTPFTLGATSVTSTGTQLNYLNAATGTTGTASTNLVYSTSPTFVTPTLGAATATSLTFSPTTGGLVGTTTNDNTTTGKVGEFVASSTAETNQAQSSATVTITIASPGVVTWGTTIPFTGNAVVNFTTTGALPTGIVAGTNYYVVGSSISGNTFRIATTIDNAIAGTAINTSGTQSGVQTGVPTGILSTGVGLNIAGISLTAGDWDVSMQAAFFSGATTSVTSQTASISTTSATAQTQIGRATQQSNAAEIPGTANEIIPVGPARISIASTTTIYAVVAASFTASTLAGWGGISARRVR